jgi:hypothetical protein
MIKKRAQLACKAEATEGTFETLAGADVIAVFNPSFKPNTEIGERPNVSSSLSRWASIAGARSAVVEFDVELKGSGAAGTAPALGKLLKCCGFGETVVASTSVTYLPASSGISSMSLALYVDGMIYKIWGARGDVSLKLEKGKPGVLHFVFTGADYSVLDGALLSSGVSYESTKPIPFMNAAFSLDSYAALVESLEFKMNNEVVLRPDVNTISGHKSAVIAGRKPTLSLDPELVLVATYDFFTKLKTHNEGALTCALTGSAGNICTITAPKVQYTAVNPADRNGVMSLGIDCQLNRNSGDDELSIAFT